MPEHQVSYSLKVLAQKQIVVAQEEYVARYSAIPFEEVLSRLQEISLEDATRIEQKKQNALAAWGSIISEDKRKN